MTYNSHVKSSVLKRIIQSDTPCEEKLTQLSTLVGVPAPITSNEESGKAVVPPNESSGGDNEERPEINERDESYKRILSGLTAKEQKNGKNILLRIESSPNISWDYKTDVLMIDGEPQLHSNLKLLIQKSVVSASPLLPVSFVRYISSLIDIQLPVQYITNLDAVNVRKGLLALKKSKESGQQLNENVDEGVSSGTAAVNDDGGNDEESVGSEESTEVSEEAPSASRTEEVGSSRKRGREEESGDEEEENQSKFRKLASGTEEVGINRKRGREEESEDEQENPPKSRKLNKKKKDRTPVKGERRSARLQLKPEFKKEWQSL